MLNTTSTDKAYATVETQLRNRDRKRSDGRQRACVSELRVTARHLQLIVEFAGLLTLVTSLVFHRSLLLFFGFYISRLLPSVSSIINSTISYLAFFLVRSVFKVKPSFSPSFPRFVYEDLWTFLLLRFFVLLSLYSCWQIGGCDIS